MTTRTKLAIVGFVLAAVAAFAAVGSASADAAHQDSCSMYRNSSTCFAAMRETGGWVFFWVAGIGAAACLLIAFVMPAHNVKEGGSHE